MKKLCTQLVSLLLILTVVIQLCPLSVFAVSEEENKTLQPQDENRTVESAGDLLEISCEVEDLRTETGKHFRLSDGTYIAVDYQQPVHYSASDGSWKDIDNRPVATAALAADSAEVYTSSIGSYQKTFAASLSDSLLFSVTDGNYEISMKLPETPTSMVLSNELGETPTTELNESAENSATEANETASVAQVLLNEALSSEAKQNATIEEQFSLPNLSATVIYEDALAGADLHYESVGYDIKESIFVNAQQTEYAYQFVLSLTNLTAQLLSDGSISILDGETQKYSIPAPYMLDANMEYSDAASYALEAKGDGEYLLTVTADSTWMNATGRAFPVQIDPSLFKMAASSNTAITNSFIRSANPSSTSSTYGFVYCGKSTSANTPGSVMGALQSYFYISDLPALPQNSRIVKAQLSLYHSGYHGSGELIIRAFELLGTPPSGTSYSDWIKSFTWNNHAAQSTTMLDAVDLTNETLYDHVNWDITSAVQSWYLNSSNNKGITLQANDANNLNAYASFGGYTHSGYKPIFYVHYRNTVGVEPYFAYQTQSAGQAGSGYVADNNLQLSLVRTHMSAASTVNAFSASHIYNSAYGTSQFTNGNAGIQSKDYTHMLLGAGWKLNVQETVRACALAGATTTYYVYLDADGTEHYFSYDSSKQAYTDEDGLNLTLTSSGTTFTITDKANNKRIFYNGYLSEIRDANGNAIYIAYNESSSHTLADFSPTSTNWRPAASGNQITSVYRKNDGASTEWLVSFTWDSANRLSSITDKLKDKTTNFYYTTTDGILYLTGISALSSSTYRVRYVYDTATSGRLKEAYDAEAKRGVEYTYTQYGYDGWDVYRIAEYDVVS